MARSRARVARDISIDENESSAIQAPSPWFYHFNSRIFYVPTDLPQSWR